MIQKETLAQRVRRRPYVIFLNGSRDLIKSFANILLAKGGLCRKLTLELYSEGSYGLKSDGRGFVLDRDWDKPFTTIQPANLAHSLFPDYSLYERDATPDDRKYYNDLTLPACVCVCAYFRYEGWRDGTFHGLCFEKGQPVSSRVSPCESSLQGVHIRFAVDPEIFPACSAEEVAEAVEAAAKALAVTVEIVKEES